MTNDDDLRQLFADATSEIRPNGTLDDIRNRTKKVDPMARRWFLPSLAAAAVMALVIGGAFWMTRDADESTRSIATPPVAKEVALYYAGDVAQGVRLFRETHKFTADESGARAAVDATMHGTPADPDYRSLWPASIGVDTVKVDDGRIVIALSEENLQAALRGVGFPAGDAAAADTRTLALEAVTRTARDALDLPDAPVVFTVPDFGADPSDLVIGVVVNPDGFETQGDDEVLAPVQISDLTNGATVEAGKLTVKGMAAAFEANINWEILVGGDAVIDSGYATAAECCTLSPFEFTTNIALEGPGTYTLVVHDLDESGEGRPVNSDSKDIVVE